MGFWEAAFLIVLFTAFPAVLLNGIAKIKKSRAAAGGGGLRASELEALVRRAVADAQAPLLRRIETLEAIATDDLPAAQRRLDDAVLGEALDAEFDADAPETEELEARRTRTRGSRGGS